MKFQRLLLLLLTLAAPVVARAQSANNVWYFGAQAGIDFNYSPPRSLADGQMDAPEGCASIADRRTGALLFYSNGAQVWNSSHSVMPNGDSLGGHVSSLQSVVIVPDPASEVRYYVFTTDASERSFRFGLQYAIVDMRADGGRGDVVAKNVPVIAPVGERLCAVKSCSDNQFWIITYSGLAHEFYSIAVTTSGVSAPVISKIAAPEYGLLEFKSSQRGDMLVMSSAMSPTGNTSYETRFLRLDHTSGKLTHITSTSGAPAFYCFSPDDKKLYLSAGKLIQYDVSRIDSASIAASADTLYDGSVYQMGGIQLAPNGKIYLAVRNQVFLAVIDEPNKSGPACSFKLNGFSLDHGFCKLQLPNVVNALNTIGIDAGPDVAVCAGDSIRLAGTGGQYFQWSPSKSLSCSDCPEPMASPSETTVYRLVVSDLLGCSATDSVTVNVRPRPEADAGADTVICGGSSVTLHSKGGTAYRWSPEAGLSCIDCPEPTVRPAASTTYTVRVTDSSGCSDEDTVRVFVADTVIANAGADVQVCAGRPVQLNASGGVIYRWSPARGLSCTNCSAPIATPDSTTRYRVDVWNEYACVSFDEVVVTVVAMPSLLEVSDTIVCVGVGVRLVARGATDVRWDASPDLSCLDCPDPIARPMSTTTYYVTGTSESGCTTIDSVTVHVVAQPAIRLSGDSIICRGSNARLTVSGAERYRWWSSQEVVSCPTCTEQLLSPGRSTTYYVEGRNAAGCSELDSFVVDVRDQPRLKVLGGGRMCADGAVAIHVEGAATYIWSPSNGLSCNDCADLIATPSSTTLYRVIGSLPGGCSDTAFVPITVDEPIAINASLPRGVRLAPGTAARIAMSIDKQITTDTMRLSIAWHNGSLSLRDFNPATTLSADGWRVLIRENGPLRFRADLVRSAPGVIIAGAVLEMIVTAYMADSLASELELSITSNTRCANFLSTSGQVILDSLCGLTSRLIEVSSELFRLDRPMPTPTSGHFETVYSIPFSGVVHLRLLDASGAVATSIVSEAVGAGEHSAQVNVASLSAGVYHLQLQFGNATREQRIVIVK